GVVNLRGYGGPSFEASRFKGQRRAFSWRRSMRPRIEFVGQAKTGMDYAAPLERDVTPAEEALLDAQDAALKLMLGVGPHIPGVRYAHSSRKRFRVWFEVREHEICCFAILIRDRGTISDY